MKLRFVFILAVAFFPAIANAQIPGYVPLSGLQGYWPFNGNANDLSGNSYNGVAQNVTPAADRFNQANSAFSFNGVTSSITTAYAGVLGTNDRAVSFWAKSTASNLIMGCVAWGSFNTAARYECGFNYGAMGPMMDGSNGCATFSPVVNPFDNNWHHYVVQFGLTNQLNQIEMYMDGTLLTSFANIYNPANQLNTQSSFSVMFGALPGAHSFQGSIDEVGIWNRRLDKCEISQLFHSGILTSSVVTSANCAGGNATLTASGLPGPYSYTWLPSGNSGSVVSNLPAGNYTNIVTNGFCTYSNTFSIAPSVNYSVSLSSSSATVCAGNSFTLQAMVSGTTSPVTYQWSNGGNSASTSVLSAVPGYYVYTCSVSQGSGCPVSATVGVQVSGGTTLSVSNSGTVCKGDSMVLSASGASSYTWLPVSFNTATISVSPQSSVILTVTANDICTGAILSRTVMVNVFPVQTASIVSSRKEICRNESVTLTASGMSGYTWQPGGSTNANATFTISGTGVFTLNCTDINGCTTKQTFTQSVLPCTGVTELSLADILVYPNPSHGIVNVSSNGKPISIRVYNVTGAELFYTGSSSEKTELDLSLFDSGLYFIRLDVHNRQPVVLRLVLD